MLVRTAPIFSTVPVTDGGDPVGFSRRASSRTNTWLASQKCETARKMLNFPVRFTS